MTTNNKETFRNSAYFQEILKKYFLGTTLKSFGDWYDIDNNFFMIHTATINNEETSIFSSNSEMRKCFLRTTCMVMYLIGVSIELN